MNKQGECAWCREDYEKNNVDKFCSYHNRLWHRSYSNHWYHRLKESGRRLATTSKIDRKELAGRKVMNMEEYVIFVAERVGWYSLDCLMLCKRCRYWWHQGPQDTERCNNQQCTAHEEIIYVFSDGATAQAFDGVRKIDPPKVKAEKKAPKKYQRKPNPWSRYGLPDDFRYGS